MKWKMSREIKFREWMPTRNKFHYWGLIEGVFIGPSDPKADHQEFTGLKDKNRKEIYEGDIVKYYVDHNGPSGGEEITETFIEEVTFIDGQFCVDGYAPVNCFPSEVIGNIYENPELLK